MQQGVCFRITPIPSIQPQRSARPDEIGTSSRLDRGETDYHLPAGQAGLSADSRVSLKVFDLLGREVVTLVEENQPAGYHQAVFDASRLSSGAYVYQLIATDEHASRQVSRKVMLLVK